jgi:excisionase family DNA binding protein
MPDASTAVITRDAIAELLAKSINVARWMSISDAAGYSGLSKRSLERLLAGGKLSAHRPVRGRLLIDRLELDSLIAGATAAPRKGRGRA